MPYVFFIHIFIYMGYITSKSKDTKNLLHYFNLIGWKTKLIDWVVIVVAVFFGELSSIGISRINI